MNRCDFLKATILALLTMFEKFRWCKYAAETSIRA